MVDLKKEVLLYFKTDQTTRALYERMKQEHGIGKRAVQQVFLSLKELGYLVQTNGHSSVGATFCISRTGRELVEYEYGISLPHPDAVKR